MYLYQYLKNLNDLVAKHPELLGATVTYVKEQCGEEFHFMVEHVATAGLWDLEDAEFIGTCSQELGDLLKNENNGRFMPVICIN